MENLVTTGTIEYRNAQGFAVGRLLKRGSAKMVTEMFGQVDPHGMKRGKTRVYRRYESLERITAPMAEGVTPEGQTPTFTEVSCTLEQFGGNIKLTDVIAWTHEDPLLQEFSDLCGDQAAECIEVMRLGVLKGGTNVFYGGGVSGRTLVTTPPNRTDLQVIERTLKRNKAERISGQINAGDKIDTTPVAAAYIAFAHPDLVPDIRKMSQFTPVEKYASQGGVHQNEIGKVDTTRFIEAYYLEPWLAAATGISSTTYLSSGAAPSAVAYPDVYPIIIVAKNAYGIVPLAGKGSANVHIINPGNPTKDDPHGQRGYVAWDTFQTAVRLNEQWLARWEVTCTARPE